ncbi:MAG: hypothetical protein H8E66_20735 [Planctomycetes bacterium]|nr:hypothetical protein [Planctomycetota bacterium]
MLRRHLQCLFAAIIVHASAIVSAAPPVEPIDIDYEPQFVFDNYVVDNHWAIKYKREAVQRVSHVATKHSANPIMDADHPSYLWVVRDAEDGLFRMWYQANTQIREASEKGRKFRTDIAYAESPDGVNWTRPDLKLFDHVDRSPNNVVVAQSNRPKIEACSPCILEVPEADRRGFKYLMLYRAKGAGSGDLSGIRIIGSNDGVHWDANSDTRIAHLHSDCPNTISYDARTKQYVMYCRAKHIYRAFGDRMIDTGASRRIARLASDALWTDWLEHAEPQTILTPDEIDNATRFNFFYGMPTRYYAGVYWGFLEPFRMNDFIHTELVTSRDGVYFDRMPGRPKMIEYGADGTWDDEMIFASPSWVEVGEEWWIYYTGWDGPHGTPERSGAFGLAKIRKEGFISMRGPRSGGVVCTRQLRWPGGDLIVNADATNGLLHVRVSDEHRKPIAGFDHDDCEPFYSDKTAHRVTWNDRSLSDLSGEVIRLEFYLQDADLYSFRATRPSN